MNLEIVANLNNFYQSQLKKYLLLMQLLLLPNPSHIRNTTLTFSYITIELRRDTYIHIVYTRIFFTNWSTNNDLHSLPWAYQSLVFVLYMYTPPVCQVMNKRINKLVHCRLMSGTGIHSMGTRDYFPVIFVVNTLLCISLLIWLRNTTVNIYFN